MTALVSLLAANPVAGDEMPGTGGCRKLRVAGRGKGKSGGYRTIKFIPALTFRCSCWRFSRKKRMRI